jgi:hypothetical protein
MSFNKKDLVIEGNRTLAPYCSEIKHYISSEKDYKALTESPNKLSVSSSVTHMVKSSIEDKAIEIFKELGLELGETTNVFYRSPEEGTDIYFDRIRIGDKFCAAPRLNLQIIPYDRPMASCQLNFEEILQSQPVVKDLLKVQASLLTGDYQIIFSEKNASMYSIILNPIAEVSSFIRDLTGILKNIKNKEYHQLDMLRTLTNADSIDPEVLNAAKGVYSRHLLSVLGVKL